MHSTHSIHTISFKIGYIVADTVIRRKKLNDQNPAIKRSLHKHKVFQMTKSIIKIGVFSTMIYMLLAYVAPLIVQLW